MKYVRQFLVILAIAFVGEIFSELVPLPIPASIYGIVILFAGLETKLIPLDAVKETGGFLVDIMPLMFIPAAVGVIDVWDLVSRSLGKYVLIMVVTTIVVMVVSGLVTQKCLGKEKDHA